MFRRIRVKICGFTRVQDALSAANLGIDGLGLVFYQKSPRDVSVAQAKAIRMALPPFVSVVGLFVNPQAEWVREVLQRVSLDHLQFHGEETDSFCRQFGLPYIKAIRVKDEQQIVAAGKQYSDACGLLLDSYEPERHGGTGVSFNWQLIPRQLDKPIILAGGLDAQNVGQGIRAVNPYGVDVSSGVESAKGIKDTEKMKSFMLAVQAVKVKE